MIDRACDALIAVVERERFAVTSRPRAKAARPESEDPTYIPADVKRAVYQRDAGRCTFTSECGERCGERRFLQIDHIVPRALGGKPTVDNLRLLCGPHNQHEANRKLGADFMDAKRAQNKLEHDLVEALTSLGYKPGEAERAVASTANTTQATFEARLRAALALLSRSRPIRCSDGPFDLSAGFPLWFALRDWRPTPLRAP